MRLTKHTLQVLRSAGSGLDQLQRGIEKESLRVARDGSLSLRPHPKALGSALTHSAITTDFSEAQLELITGVHDSPEGCLDELSEIHHYVHTHLDNELLWPSSMPCILGTENESIPIGQYGHSNIGLTKNCLSPRPRSSLRTPDANDFRHSLQFFQCPMRCGSIWVLPNKRSAPKPISALFVTFDAIRGC